MNRTIVYLIIIFSGFFFRCSKYYKVNKKNVLMIIVDDMKPEISSWGNETIITPNIDSLVQNGISFKQAYAQYANCSPSRMSFLTGISPHRLGHTGRLNEKKQFVDHVTLPGHFKENGYFTASFGKVYHDKNDDSKSWDYIYDVELNDNRQIPWESYASEKNRNLKGYDRPATESSALQMDSYNDYRISIEAIKQIEINKNRPFFMAVGFRKPHLPFAAPKKYWDIYKRDEIPDPKFSNAPKHGDTIVYQWSELASYSYYYENYYSNNYRNSKVNLKKAKELKHGYFACISYIDDLVGGLIKKLKELKLDKNTIIVFMSDHGFHLGDQQIWGKHSSYELSTRVPLIIIDPSQKIKGSKCFNFVELIDVYPTLADIAETKQPINIDGKSLYEFIERPNKVNQEPAYSQYQTFQKNRSFSDYMAYTIYTKDFNYIEWQDLKNNRKVVQKELYNMSDSRIEKENISSEIEFSQIIKKLSIKIHERFQL